jgi:hypothetical protein
LIRLATKQSRPAAATPEHLLVDVEVGVLLERDARAEEDRSVPRNVRPIVQTRMTATGFAIDRARKDFSGLSLGHGRDCDQGFLGCWAVDVGILDLDHGERRC